MTRVTFVSSTVDVSKLVPWSSSISATVGISSLTFRLGYSDMTLRVKLSLPQIANWQYMIYISVLGVFQAMYIV